MKKPLILMLVLMLFVAGCGATNIAKAISKSYPLENIVSSQTGIGTAEIYRAKNTSVHQLAEELSGKYEPIKMSAKDSERMFLVYDRYLVSLMKDIEKPEDTLIEVATKDFVRNNYDVGFFEAYLMANIIRSTFQMDTYNNRKYRGYIDGGGYTTYHGTLSPKEFVKSIRTGSVGNRTVRGGGPGVGK